MNWQDETTVKKINLKGLALFRARLWPYLQHYRPLLFGSMFLVICSTLASLVTPWLLGFAVDHVLVPKAGHLLIPVGLLILGIHLVEALTTYSQSCSFTFLGQKVLHDLRQDLLKKYVFYPVSEYNRTPTGKMVTRLVNDTSNLQDLFTSGLAVSLGNIAVVFGILVWLVILHPRLGFVCVSVFPLMIVSSRLFSKLIREAFRQSRSALSRVNAFLAENISGMGIIQVFNKEKTFRTRFDEVSQEYTRTQIKSIKSFAYFQPTITILSSCSMSILVIYGGFCALEGTVTLGLLVSFMAYLHALYSPIRDITEKYNLFLSAMTSCERIFEFMDRSQEAGASDELTIIPHRNFEGRIELINVSFRYDNAGSRIGADTTLRSTRPESELRTSGGLVASPEGQSGWRKADLDPWVLKNIDFLVLPGERIGIVGHTGAGKTTLSGLLMRFYDAQEGRILLDGQEIGSIPDRRILRQQMGYIQQEPFLFSGTIEDNIFLWEPSCRHVYEKLPEFARAPFESGRLLLKNEIYEKGTNLSVGERQMISFMRAVVQEPSIYILDEATAHMDSLTEQWIEKVSHHVFQGKTTFIIAHRLSTLRTVDRILVFHHGQLVESGTHQELLTQQGIYYKLYQIQSRKEELEGTASVT